MLFFLQHGLFRVDPAHDRRAVPTAGPARPARPRQDHLCGWTSAALTAHLGPAESGGFTSAIPQAGGGWCTILRGAARPSAGVAKAAILKRWLPPFEVEGQRASRGPLRKGKSVRWMQGADRRGQIARRNFNRALAVRRGSPWLQSSGANHRGRPIIQKLGGGQGMMGGRQRRITPGQSSAFFLQNRFAPKKDLKEDHGGPFLVMHATGRPDSSLCDSRPCRPSLLKKNGTVKDLPKGFRTAGHHRKRTTRINADLLAFHFKKLS